MTRIQSLLTRYKTIPKAVKASFWFIVCSVLQKGISFLTIPLFTRMMSTDEFGQVSLFQTWVAIIEIFATLELSAGVYNKGLAKFQNAQNEFTSSMMGLSTVCTSLVFLIYFILKDTIIRLTGVSELAYLFLFLNLLFWPAISFWTMKKRFEFSYVSVVAVSLALSILSPAMGFVMVSLSTQKGLARIISICLTNIIIGAILYLVLMLRGKQFINLKFWKYGLLFNLPLIPHYLSTIVLGQADRIMIDNRFGETPVAKYSVVYGLSMMMNIVTGSINATFIPWTYQECEKNRFDRIAGYASFLLLLIGIIAFVPALLGPELMRIIAPPEYYDAVYAIPPITCSVYYIFLYSLFCNIEFAFEETKFVSVASAFAALSNILLNYCFMKWFGYLCAAYTTLACYILLAAAHAVFYKVVLKKRALPEIYDLKKTVLISAFITIGSLLVSLLYPFVAARYILIAAVLVLAIVYRAKIIAMLSDFKKKV